MKKAWHLWLRAIVKVYDGWCWFFDRPNDTLSYKIASAMRANLKSRGVWVTNVSQFRLSVNDTGKHYFYVCCHTGIPLMLPSMIIACCVFDDRCTISPTMGVVGKNAIIQDVSLSDPELLDKIYKIIVEWDETAVLAHA